MASCFYKCLVVLKQEEGFGVLAGNSPMDEVPAMSRELYYGHPGTPKDTSLYNLDIFKF